MPPPLVHALRRYELSLPVRYRADAVLTVSDPLRDLFMQAGFPEKRIRPIYYGLDAALFRPGLAEDAELSGPPVVVMHGSFDEHHLGPIAVAAAVRLGELRPDARWRFVGRETTVLRRFVATVRRRRPGFAPERPGFLPYEQVPAAVAGGSVGVTPYEPSTGTHCAFVAKTVEYLALGLPVVSTPLASAQRYYAGLGGVRFAQAEGGSVAEELAGWLALPAAERRAQAAETGDRVRQELDWPAVCGRAAEVIERVAGGPAAGVEFRSPL
ncbi:MAG TPA: glycosyltransferase, partial [Verrucomicrobiota bacterium]|nr:glycosyltransferase [Verrucomicrobiota bacterium]